MKHVLRFSCAVWWCVFGLGFTSAALAQSPPPHCDLTIGCHFELVVGTRGTYTNFVIQVGPDAEHLAPYTFAIVEPKTVVQETQVGIVQKFSGTIVHFQTTINLYDDNGNLTQTQNLESRTGGTPVAQQWLYTICATSPTEPDICTELQGLSAT